MIAEAVAEDASIDQVRQLIADIFATSDARKVECPNCGTEFRTPIPDVKAQVAAMIDLLEQAEGKAEQKPTEATTVIIERPPR